MAAERHRIICAELIRACCIRCQNRTVECTEIGEFELCRIGKIKEDALRAESVISGNRLAVEHTAARRNRQRYVTACDIDDNRAVIGYDKINGWCCPESELREGE